MGMGENNQNHHFLILSYMPPIHILLLFCFVFLQIYRFYHLKHHRDHFNFYNGA